VKRHRGRLLYSPSLTNLYTPSVKIVVSGGSGFIGEAVCRALLPRGDVFVLSRNPESVKVGRGVAWNPAEKGPWEALVASADVVINLAGETIAALRWTDAKKRRLVESRVDVTRALVRAFREGEVRARRLINASAVGYYGSRGDEWLEEDSAPGSGFFGELGTAWESAAREAEDVAAVTIARFGIVLGKGGGIIGAMVPPFRLGLGGRLGSGEQWVSWIDRHDLVHMIEWLLDDPRRSGVYNATSPFPVRNIELTRTLGSILRRLTIVPAPAFVLRLVSGEMADEVLLSSQRVVPRRALDEGFVFEYPELEDSLRRVLGEANDE
jgi:uncharacterized protein